MTISRNPAESKSVTIIDSIMFFVLLIVLCCRLFINESLLNSLPDLGRQGAGQMIIGFGSASYIFFMDMLLMSVCALWAASRFWGGSFIWDRTQTLIPSALLLVASIVSVCCASNKYLAFLTSLTLLSSVCASMVFVQLLACSWRRHFLLVVIIALGCSLVYRCHQQKNEEIRYNLQAMQDDYEGFMAANGYEPDSWQARQFQERVMSMDTGGYFSVSNTAGSYLILTAFCSLALSAAYIRNKPVAFLALAAFLFQGYGIWLTESTGARLSLFAGLVFVVLLFLMRRIRCRRLLFGLFLIVLCLVPVLVWYYGCTHDRLPTSNLWIRWQYWRASAAMIADHWLTGVGPGNFGSSYLLYMNPFSPEAVKDPHCVVLAILSQWGIVGLVALVWAALASVYYLAVRRSEAISSGLNIEKLSPSHIFIWVAAIFAGILFAYYFSIDTTFGNSPFAVFLYISGSRAFIFSASCIVFLLLINRQGCVVIDSHTRFIVILLAGLAAFALHNTIDFAFFAPGVCIMFSAVVALAVSYKNELAVNSKSSWQMLRFNRLLSVLIMLGLVITWIYVGSVVFRAESLKSSAAGKVVSASAVRSVDIAIQAAADAARGSDINRFDPEGYRYAGKIYYQAFQASGQEADTLFQNAEYNILLARETDPKNPEYDKMLGDFYFEKANGTSIAKAEKVRCYKLAENYYSRHVSLYPGNSDVLVVLAKIRLIAGDVKQARSLAQKALDIESGCMKLQPKLFPHRQEFFHRMSDENIQAANDILLR